MMIDHRMHRLVLKVNGVEVPVEKWVYYEQPRDYTHVIELRVDPVRIEPDIDIPYVGLTDVMRTWAAAPA